MIIIRSLGVWLALLLAACPSVADEDLIQTAHRAYDQKVRSLEKEVNALFQIDFTEASKTYGPEMRALETKISVAAKLDDPAIRRQRIQQIQNEYRNSELDRYLQAFYYLQNELEKDHRFVGEYLSLLEEALDKLIREDPFFSTIFLSQKFKDKNGLILKRVAWQPSRLYNVSAETSPLKIHSLFADTSRTPILIKLTPAAFSSPAFLRSILIHEINHALLYKDPLLSKAEILAGPVSPSYQYYLLHEYYGLKAQILWDDEPRNTNWKLDEANRENIGKMLEWTYAQLSEKNKKFVTQNPNPPIMRFTG